MTLRRLGIGGAFLAMAVSGCTVGPDYQRPSAPISPSFKEAAGWTPAHPVDAVDKGAWWSMFNDPVLDGLERRVALSNQTVKQYEAAYREARQIVSQARASYFPTLSIDARADRSRGAGSTISNAASTGALSTGTISTGTTTTGAVSTGTTTTGALSTTSGSTTQTTNSFEAVLEAAWVPDLFGRVRRTVESDKALAQASAADLANAQLAAQASLAQDYFAVRVLDEQSNLYTQTVAAYQRFLKLTQDQVREGSQPESVVITAETQLYGAQATLVAVGVMRAKMEHAIAVLAGVAPSELTIAPGVLTREVPTPPTALPSTLLERRPDIAAAERRMASGNALIGVAVSGYFPSLTLSGDYGVAGSSLGHLFNASDTLWSLGAEAAETLVDFGLRKAQVRAARAVYDGDVAVYRQTVLTAFQGVEDELATLRIDQQQQELLSRTEAAAQRALKLDLDEYREGTIDYTTVLAAQATALTASVNTLNTLQERLQASVLLVENLGGGWDATSLSTR